MTDNNVQIRVKNSGTEALDFTGRVAIVTGAGRGIGRAHAEMLAARGATVVVNDLGVHVNGGGIDTVIADSVVQGITSRGGTAVTDASDVASPSGADDLVNRAISEFGRLDIVINNAGIYTVEDVTDVDLPLMQKHFDVHIGGSLNMIRAAWPHMFAAGYGRIVLTTSMGALGLANAVAYSAAKAGLIGMGRSLAQAGIDSNIKVNMVAPMAVTRMTGQGAEQTPVETAERAPGLVSPLVAVLCHESCPTTGETYMSGMRRFTRIFMAETMGVVHPTADVSPEDVLASWPSIIDPSEFSIATDTISWSEINEERLTAAPL